MFNHRVNKNFSTLPTKSALTQAISYTFLDKHFLLIENMSSEASSSESFILLLFFSTLQEPLLSKIALFQKISPIFPFIFPNSLDDTFLFCAISCKFYHQKPKQFLIFFASNFTQFSTIYRNMIFGSSRNTILIISTLTNPSKSLRKLPLNLCTKLLPEKCMNSTNHALNRFYLHIHSHKIIVTFPL